MLGLVFSLLESTDPEGFYFYFLESLGIQGAPSIPFLESLEMSGAPILSFVESLSLGLLSLPFLDA